MAETNPDVNDDEWVDTPDGKFRAWYVCLAPIDGWGNTCGTVIPEKMWQRYPEFFVQGQKFFYCVCCGAKYRTKFGMLVEFSPKARNSSRFMRAEISTNHEDVRALYHEELWNLVPHYVVVHPARALRPCVDDDFWGTPDDVVFDKSMIMKLNDSDKANLMQLPKFEWDWI